MKGTKEQNTNKGITLIALVITIIVMLILVAVTISMAVNGGLFEYTGKATGEAQNAIKQEGDMASGKVTVDNKVYNSIDDYLAGKPAPVGYEEAEKDETTGVLKEKAKYTDGNGNTAVIPKGFVVSSVEKEQTIENGLVIKDENGNEFVWIPVKKAIVTEAEIAKIKEDDNTITTDLAAVQKMVNSGTYPMAVQVGEIYKGILYDFSGSATLTATVYDWTDTTSNREPANLSASDDTTLYQNAFDNMVKSVSDNGGFYVGRYEISSGTYTLEDESTVTYAQSKSNQTALVGGYNFEDCVRDYAKYNTNLGVTSETIWGSQWDQMMIFVNGKDDGAENPEPFYVTTEGSRKSGEAGKLTGMHTIDQVANIFDLEGSRFEWTQEKSSGGIIRCARGGLYKVGGNASLRHNEMPIDTTWYSTRTALYIN